MLTGQDAALSREVLNRPVEVRPPTLTVRLEGETLTIRLEGEKRRLEQRLKDVNEALEAINASSRPYAE